MAENRDVGGEETIGNASQTYTVNRGRFATKTGQKDIIEQARFAPTKTTRYEAKPKKKGHRVLRTALAASLVAGGAAAAVESTFHPIEHIIQEAAAEYKIGEVLNPNKVFEVKVVNSFDKQGHLVKPHVMVSINGQVRSVPLDDPHLSDVFRQDVFRGFTVIGAGDYSLGEVKNPDFKQNLANVFGLPKDIGAHFNHIKIGDEASPRAVYFQPVGGFYTENGRQY